MRKKAIVVHSGGMDSSICLALAKKKHGPESVLSLSFDYKQRHSPELKQAAFIAKSWGIDHDVMELPMFDHNALTDPSLPFHHEEGKPPNTMVVGRNGLMARLAAIYAYSVQANEIYLGVMENEQYRDCSRKYMDLMQEILRMDLDNRDFTIETPLVAMTKKESLELAAGLGILPFLLENTITCYDGIPYWGCKKCPACLLKNEGLSAYMKENNVWFDSY